MMSSSELQRISLATSKVIQPTGCVEIEPLMSEDRTARQPNSRAAVQTVVEPQGADVLPRFASHCVALAADVRGCLVWSGLVRYVCFAHNLQQTTDNRHLRGVHSHTHSHLHQFHHPFPL